MQFKTYFARPAKIRFEWGSSENVVWSDGEAFHISHHGRVSQRNNLIETLSYAAGVSRLSVLLILGRLCPDLIPLSFLSLLRDVSIGEEAIVNGMPCLRLVGRLADANDTQIFFGKKDLLIRQILQKRVTDVTSAQYKYREELIKELGGKMPPATMEYVYSYPNISINQTLPATLFTSGKGG